MFQNSHQSQEAYQKRESDGKSKPRRALTCNDPGVVPQKATPCGVLFTCTNMPLLGVYD
jgi:hypothetical protein